ncbi:MAG: hypothetical protein IPH20_17035 [Bacteroidales bacterium]|nr:hypothetical protein [Bacteroidales bacterium]
MSEEKEIQERIQTALKEEKTIKERIREQTSKFEKEAEEIKKHLDSLQTDKQKVDEILKGIIEIVRDGENPDVRTILSELTTIRTKLHGSLNSLLPMLVSFLIILSLYAFLYIKGDITGNSSTLVFVFGIFAFIILSFPLSYIWEYWLKRKERWLLEQIGKYRVTEELKDEADPDAFFRKLIHINFTHIDNYYRQTQIQANKSFWISLICSIAAFGIIIYGIYLMNSENTQPAYITTAAGILSEFIAAVFFYLYNKTVSEMGEYHQKLVLTQNVSLAIKITQDIAEPDDKKKAQVFIIEQLIKDINQHMLVK